METITSDKFTEVRPTDPAGWLTTWTPESGEEYSAVRTAYLPLGVNNPYREITAAEHEQMEGAPQGA